MTSRISVPGVVIQGADHARAVGEMETVAAGLQTVRYTLQHTS